MNRAARWAIRAPRQEIHAPAASFSLRAEEWEPFPQSHFLFSFKRKKRGKKAPQFFMTAFKTICYENWKTNEHLRTGFVPRWGGPVDGLG